MTRLLRLWLTFDTPLVDRRIYLAHGLGLAVVKYAGDLAIVAATTGRLWTPASYLHSVPSLRSTTFDGAPPWLMPALFLWTLPFLWAGITLTARRAIDAGWPAWFALGFFVPYLRSRRGEFRLVEVNGRTRLEGSTWYELEMAPEGYWQVFSDALIRRIHLRVLAHIKREVEGGA